MIQACQYKAKTFKIITKKKIKCATTRQLLFYLREMKKCIKRWNTKT